MATRYFVAGGDGNYGSTSNWSTTSGGAGGSSVPTSADDVFFDANSPNCTVNSSARTVLSLNCTGYAGTITLAQDLSINGNVTLSATMSFAGTGALRFTATSTITSNGLTVATSVTFANSGVTYTLADDLHVSGLLTIGGNTSNFSQTINGNKIYASGSFVHGGWNIGGTTELVLNGTGSWTNNGTGYVGIPLTIDTAGTITISGTVIYRAGALTHVAGTVITTGSTLTVTTGTTFDCAGINWNNVTFAGSSANTLTSALNVYGLLTISHSGNLTNSFSGADVNVYGSLTTTVGGTISGTSTFKFLGTGTWTGGSATSNGSVTNNIEINTAGTLTLTGLICYRSGTITHTAGTVVGTNSILFVQSNSITITINAAGFSLGTLMTSGTSVTFNGTNGCTFEGIWIRSTGTITLKSGCTYTVTKFLFSSGSASSANSIVASTASSAAYLNFRGFVCNLFYSSITDIDSSGGGPCYTVYGTLTRAVNWTQTTELVAPSVKFAFM